MTLANTVITFSTKIFIMQFKSIYHDIPCLFYRIDCKLVVRDLIVHECPKVWGNGSKKVVAAQSKMYPLSIYVKMISYL